jgi:hypothetical protein
VSELSAASREAMRQRRGRELCIVFAGATMETSALVSSYLGGNQEEIDAYRHGDGQLLVAC